MKKICVVLLVLMVAFAMPLMAQDEEMAKTDEMAEMAPPPPLDDEFLTGLVGQWEGWSKSTMGESEDHLTYQMAFGGQYLMLQFKSTSDMGDFTGGGVYTVDENGDYVGLWVDSMRDMAKGKGSLEGNVMTMVWDGKFGKYTQVVEKVDDDKLKINGKFEMGDQVMESTSELTRVKEEMTDKME